MANGVSEDWLESTGDLPLFPTTARLANAFLYGLLFNQGQSSARSWIAPYRLEERFGTLAPERLMGLEHELAACIGDCPALHRFPAMVGRYLSATAAVLLATYGGDARGIWRDHPPTDSLSARFRQFPGIGPHKAMIGAYLISVYGFAEDNTGLSRRISEECPKLHQAVESQWAGGRRDRHG